jgi:hypothetical protein
MTIERGVRKERRDRYGEGTIRQRSRSIGLLYYRGYARRPSEVKRLIPELSQDYRLYATKRGERPRSLAVR